MLRYSTDGGQHWSGRIDVPNDPQGKANQHDQVTLAWLADGRLFAGWRDRRCCGGSFDSAYQEWVRVLRPDSTGRLTPGRTVQFTNGPQPAPTGSGRGALQPTSSRVWSRLHAASV